MKRRRTAAEHSTRPNAPPLSAAAWSSSADERVVAAGAFKARCLELMDRVRETQVEYTITKHGRPVAKLVPCDDLPAESFGFLAGCVVAEGDIVSPDHEAWDEAGPQAPLGHRRVGGKRQAGVRLGRAERGRAGKGEDG